MPYCCVPGCERIKRANNRRFLFNFPKKEELLQKWLEAIPSLERPIKTSCRVCQHHFEPNDILGAYSHTIGGKKYLIERERARLKPNAVPTTNLGNSLPVNGKIKLKRGKTAGKASTLHKDEIASDNNGKPPRIPETVEILRVEQICEEIHKDEITSHNNAKPLRIPEMVEILEVEQICNGNNVILCSQQIRQSDIEKPENSYEGIKLHCDDFTIADDCGNRSSARNKVDILEVPEIEGSNLSANRTKSPTSTASESFDLFDSVFEVVLPTTLWGVHRSPNQKRIMFVCIDEEELNINKMLTVNDTGEIKTYLEKRLISEECWPTNDLTPERISEMLEELDVMQICLGAAFSENCEIVLKGIDSDEKRGTRLCIRCMHGEFI
ncbi:uncharacterized protein LOC118733485 [Rhagoletis pomonella]|uniref:uncharacterized protein LOC118733485 n=1 Tax=Rhagoletis pomonella TaxID=28610 RepID=UPI001782DAF8|nr:uncharacterized protein LOC118733485 [Rhagoletis pomonella]